MDFVSYSTLIRESHIDSLGHVNNAAYLELYEEARWEQIAPRGFGVADIQRMMQAPVVLEANIKFMRELRLREKITLTGKILSYEGKIGKMQQTILKEDGTVASEAVFIFGLFDLKARKLIEPTAEWKAAIGL